ncbi:hypothetical protein [uncultured Deinococcus sp.]|uniref:hypothetical protein n=1 Tax=uncultured Deinococcus sp. TaxID=158789 RepID=UPI0025FBF40A|nr:hypothetical protein [uncultured Deinococcus sp.]
MTSPIDVPNLLAGTILPIAIQAGHTKWNRWRQQQSLINHLHTRLGEVLGSSTQAEYIVQALERARGPRPLSAFDTVNEIRALVERALPAPSIPFHTLRLEQDLVLALLAEAIQISVATTPAERLNVSLDQGERLARLAPSLHRVMSDYRERARQPLRAAGQDIAAIAIAAGQRQLKLTYDAEGRVTAEDLKLSLRLSGDNAMQMTAWLLGDQLGPRTLLLTPGQGDIGFTSGHPALDDILRIQDNPEALVFQRPVATRQVRCRITQGTTVKHVNGTLSFDGDTQETVLQMGSERLTVHFHMVRSADGQTPSTKASWIIKDAGEIFTGDDVRWLDALLLIVQAGTQVAITAFMTPEGGRQELPEATDLLTISSTDDLSDDLFHLQVYRALARAAQHIEEAGYDTAHLPTPEPLNEFDLAVLWQLDQLLQGTYEPRVAGELTIESPQIAALLQAQPEPDAIVHITQFIVGPYAVVAEQPLRDVVANQLPHDGSALRFHLTAVAGNPRLRVQPAPPPSAGGEAS